MSPDAGPPATPTIDLARSAADAATSVDDVVRLDTGVAGEFATYGLGGRVPGVRVDVDRAGHAQVRVRVVVRFGRSIPDIGDRVQAEVLGALRTLGVDGSVHVHVADITEDADPRTRSLPTGSA